MLMWVATVALVVGAANVVEGQGSVGLPPMEFSHSVIMDPYDKYLMMWTPRDNDIVIEVQVATRGWVGLGFSPSGGMKGADIVLGWVDEGGQPFLHDRFATGYMVPAVDESQDVTLLGGYENDTHTILRFSRPWTTCDTTQDLQLSDDTVRVIWSHSFADPTDETTMRRHDERGTKSLYLREPQLTPPEMTSDVKTWDIFAGNVSVPDNLDTVYWCKIFKVPPLRRKVHVIGYVPIIEPKNLKHVHHLLVYQCHVPESSKYYERWLGMDSVQCYSQNMPQSWRYCYEAFIAWAVGGLGETMPEHVGFPLGEEHGGATYFLLQMHYDNPYLKSGIVDNSGVRVFYTEKLREYDAGVLTMGHTVSHFQVVPPGQKWLSVGHCSGSCTQQYLPVEGVQAFQGLLHSHLLGSSLSLRHIRNGTELPPILSDKTYDFNYQQMRAFREEVTLLPGDHLIMECNYDASARRKPTFGGLSSEEEMCLAFLSYYPRVDLSMCESAPVKDSLFNSLGVLELYDQPDGSKPESSAFQIDEEWENTLHEMSRTGNLSEATDIKFASFWSALVAKAPQKHLNKTMLEILEDEGTWRDEGITSALQEATLKGPQMQQCIGTFRTGDPKMYRESTIEYPSFTPFRPEAKPCVKGLTGAPEASETSASSGITGAASTSGTQPSSGTQP